ncbi:hypothetical protein D8780_08945 [Notoacmeibacter ruber]|uniref:Uncharacterized protein n=2 Tax=Notoacmeibacter ruber TaxID=2670375 RepID=A0A3L7JIJ3_9HYPH|nr:hypothetical protein D8780_08945 [Notoacmeibacter ruber]
MRERIEGYKKTVKRKSDARADAGASSHISSKKFDIDFAISGNASISNEEFTEYVIEASHFIDISEIRLAFNELAESFGVEQIVFLIDEWSQIDRNIQPIFAEMIRRTIGTSNRISCKIGALKYLTSFTSVSSGRRIGLQPGIDITELTDLNHIFTFDLDKESVKSFLLLILLKHFLEAIGREIYEMDFNDPTKFIAAQINAIFDKLFSEVFESEKAFDFFVRTSEGNPRDFLAMIAECCATHGTAQLPISMKAVQASAINYFANTKVSNFDGSSQNSLELFELLFQHCLHEKTKIFSVSTDVDRQSLLLQDLWAQRLIHLIDNNYQYYNDVIGKLESYVIYAIDYGKILSLRASEDGQKVLQKMVDGTGEIIDGLYDGATHRSIMESIENGDPQLAAITKIMSAAPNASDVTDQADILTAESLHEKVISINADGIIKATNIALSSSPSLSIADS